MLQKVSLFPSKRDFFLFLLACGFILTYALLIEYQNYKKLTYFDSCIVDATVLKQYTKTKETKRGKLKSYQVLKLKSDKGFSFYTTVSKNFTQVKGKKLQLIIFADAVTFHEYFTSFYARSIVLQVDKSQSLRNKLDAHLSQAHNNAAIANIYQALYTAAPLERELQTLFSNLGVSHLLAISGFHLGVLSALLFFLLKTPYKFFQDRYFPYRNAKSDLFVLVASTLLVYVLFLDAPPSLLRAFAMLLIGFILYDRGMKIVSMQTLLLSVLLLLSLFPRLFFSLGFWLSVSGVFYIFLFLIHFKQLNKYWQFFLLPFFVYLLMLPFSLAIFGTFSFLHPLSILWTTLFTPFYPLSILLHFIGFADLFDTLLESFMTLGKVQNTIPIPIEWLYLHIILSFLGMWKKYFMWLLLFYSFSIFVYAMYHVT